MTREPGPSTVTDPTDSDDGCPGCGALDGVQPHPAPPAVQAWTCTTCDLRWCTTVVNPTVRAALAVVGLLPTRQQRTAALLDVMAAEVTRRSKEHTTMATTVRFPLDQVVQFDTMATVDTTIWWCRICQQEATATTTPQATSDAITHLSTDHGGVR